MSRLSPMITEVPVLVAVITGLWRSLDLLRSLPKVLCKKNQTHILLCSSNAVSPNVKLEKQKSKQFVPSFKMRYCTSLYLIYFRRYGKIYENFVFPIFWFLQDLTNFLYKIDKVANNWVFDFSHISGTNWAREMYYTSF